MEKENIQEFINTLFDRKIKGLNRIYLFFGKRLIATLLVLFAFVVTQNLSGQISTRTLGNIPVIHDVPKRPDHFVKVEHLGGELPDLENDFIFEKV